MAIVEMGLRARTKGFEGKVSLIPCGFWTFVRVVKYITDGEEWWYEVEETAFTTYEAAHDAFLTWALPDTIRLEGENGA